MSKATPGAKGYPDGTSSIFGLTSAPELVRSGVTSKDPQVVASVSTGRFRQHDWASAGDSSPDGGAHPGRRWRPPRLTALTLAKCRVRVAGRAAGQEACDTRVRRLSSRISAGRLVPCRLASSCRACRSSSVKRTRTLAVSFRCSLLLTSSSGTSAGVHATSS